MKIGRFFILGDSYSTFEGYIPEGFAPYYVKSGRDDNNLENVEQTWWRLLSKDTGAELAYNCSWSGTTICHTGYDGVDDFERSFITRFENLVRAGYFEKNQIDTFFVFGGTNDSWANVPLGESKYSDWTKEDLYCFRPAMCYLTHRLKEVLPNTDVIFIINTGVKYEISEAVLSSCRKNGQGVLVLKNIDKLGGHPTIKGMRQIADQLEKYMKEYFIQKGIKMKKYSNVNEYIEANWDGVIRECRADKGELVGVPYPFTVPAVDRFESLYYWDTHFTNVGLYLCGREMLAKNNTDNIMYLIEKFGFMPNSNGTYHLDHSQPPFLSIMVKDTYKYYGDKVWLGGAYDVLCKEYDYWMTKRSTPIGLNRYDTNTTDRDYLASRAPDYEKRVHRQLPYDRADIGRHYLATCESGYDCSSRFEFEIYNFAPVCLNSLLYALETNMAYFAKEIGKSEETAAEWKARAEKRAQLMKKYMLDENGCFRDYNYVTGKVSNDFSCASVFPLCFGLADEKNAADFMAQFYRLEAKYGVLANEKNDFEGNFQWGYPNGWAPHQIMAIEGLDKYGYKTEAMRVAEKYVTVIDNVFEVTGELWEKYNVISGTDNVEDESQGGMPPMMGWTASAYLFAQDYISKNK